MRPRKKIFVIVVILLAISSIYGLRIAQTQMQTQPQPKPEESQQKVVPVQAIEDLMREHGLLQRILLVQEELARRIEAGDEVPMDALRNMTTLVQTFIQRYHEVLEERFMFKQFRDAGKMTDLVDVLFQQHEAGRHLMSNLRDQMRYSEGLKQVAVLMREYVRFYRPHMSREDTVLFPAFHQFLTPEEYKAMGEKFEEWEKTYFGENGFEKQVSKVEETERVLGLYDLSQYTPKPGMPLKEDK